MTGAANQATMSCNPSKIRRESNGFPLRVGTPPKPFGARRYPWRRQPNRRPSWRRALARKSHRRCGRPPDGRRLPSELLFGAVDEALQQFVEQLIRPGAGRPIFLPRRLLGDLQPGGIVLERKRLHLNSRLGKGLNSSLVSFPLGRLEEDVGDGGRFLERLSFWLAQALPNGLRYDDRREDGEGAVAAADGDELCNLVDTKAHESLKGVLHDGKLAAFQRRPDLAQRHWEYAGAGSSEHGVIVVASAATRREPLHPLRSGDGPRSADHPTVEPPPRQDTKALFLAELLQLDLEFRPLEQACRFGIRGDAGHGDDGKLRKLCGRICHRIDGHLDPPIDDGFVLLGWIGDQARIRMDGDHQIRRTPFELGSEHTRRPVAR